MEGKDAKCLTICPVSIPFLMEHVLLLPVIGYIVLLSLYVSQPSVPQYTHIGEELIKEVIKVK